MKNFPPVSICIPTYNGASYLKETLECAIHQTYKNIEIVITDDNSSDETVAICTSYAQKDNRIKFFQNKTNLGLKGNWCEVIDRTSEKSEWIKFLFQDDLMELTTVEKMITSALTNNVDFVLCDRTYIFEKSVSKKIRKSYARIPKTEEIFHKSKVYSPAETAKLIHKFSLHNCLGEPPCIFFKKSTYSHSDYPSEFIQLIDYVFILEKILVNDFYFFNEKLVKFRVHDSSQTSKNTNSKEFSLKNLHKTIHVHYYEKIKLCYLILTNNKYVQLKHFFSETKILNIIQFLFYKSLYKNPNYIDEIIHFYEGTELHLKLRLNNKHPRNIYFNYKIKKHSISRTRKRYKL